MSVNQTFSNSSNFGIINISVANLRIQPVYQSELINQIILGKVVPVYEEQNDFYYVENIDGYRGWVSKSSLFLTTLPKAEEWNNSKKIFFTGLNGFVTRAPELQSEGISDLVFGALLKKINEFDEFEKVGLPDGREGYVPKAVTMDLETQQSYKPTPDAIVTIAKRFLGLPYLWGGTSSKAFDCSGFVQTIFGFLNVKLPRNASQMITLGKEIKFGKEFDDLVIGDLLFFGKTIERVTHVAMYLGNKQYIHADGFVHVNSLIPENSDYNEYRRKTLLKIKRIL